MEMVRMITTSSLVYAGKSLAAGEEFDCEKTDVHVLTVTGRARVKEAESTYLTRNMTARRGRRAK